MRPPNQLGTRLFFALDFFTSTVISFIIRYSIFLPAKVNTSPGFSLLIKYSSITPTKPPLINFTFSMASLTMVPICIRCRIAIRRSAILYNPSSTIIFLNSSYCCNAFPPCVRCSNSSSHSSSVISAKQWVAFISAKIVAGTKPSPTARVHRYCISTSKQSIMGSLLSI